MSAFPSTAAFEMEMRDEWYGRMSHWVCIYFCLSLPVLFLKGAAAVFCVSAVRVMGLDVGMREADIGVTWFTGK